MTVIVGLLVLLCLLCVLCVYLGIRLHYAKAAGYEQYCDARRLRAELLAAEIKVSELEGWCKLVEGLCLHLQEELKRYETEVIH